MILRPLLLGLLAAASARGADDTIVLSPMLVTSALDKSREDIVPSLGATSYTLSADQISAQSLGANASFNQVLLRTPSMAEDSFGQVHLRGEHANLQYRINDVLLPEGIAGFGQELDVPFISSVAVITGTLPAQYGYRTAGVIDLHTQTRATMAGRGAATLFAGSFDTVRTSAEAGAGQGNLTAFATASLAANNQGIENPAATAAPLHDRSRQTKAFVDVSDLIDPANRATLLLGVSAAGFQIPNAPAFARVDENQIENNDYAILSFQHSGGWYDYEVSGFSRYSLTHFSPDVPADLAANGVASDVHQDLWSNGFEADGKWVTAKTHTLRAGALIIATQADTRTSDAVYPVAPDGGARGGPFWIADRHGRLGTQAGVYAQDEWKASGPLTVNFGLRADEAAGATNEGQISPRLNLVAQLGGASVLHAGYARYFTPPPLELTETPDLGKFAGTSNAPAVDLNSPIRSERADSVDVGITQQLSPDLSVTLDAYDKRSTEQLDEGRFGAALIFAAFNYRTGRIDGAELSANYAHAGWSAYGNFAVGRATGRAVTSGEFQFGPDELAYLASHSVPLDHDQRLTASAGVSYQQRGNLVYADLLYGSGLRRGFANSDHLPDYHPLNLGVEHAFALTGGRRKIALRFEVANVFDEIYLLRDGSGLGVFAPQYGSRRGLFGSARYSF